MVSQAGVLPPILALHAEEAAFLWTQRERAVQPSRTTLTAIMNFDTRIAAHLDGLRVAAEGGWDPSTVPLGSKEPGAVFAFSVGVLEAAGPGSVVSLLSQVEHTPAIHSGLLSAFGWTSTRFLRGTVKGLLASSSDFQRRVGIACCGMHGVDPKGSLEAMMRGPSSMSRAIAFRACASIGRGDLAQLCAAGIDDEDPVSRENAAVAAVLLGDRRRALETLARSGTAEGPSRESAMSLSLQALSLRTGHQLLQEQAVRKDRERWVIEGSGVVGDPSYLPWLVTQMRTGSLARLAGDAFALITGADLAQLAMGHSSQTVETGPTDNPDDENIAMEPDHDLVWPDVDKIERWWAANAPRFQKGTRYFMGAPVTREHCIEVLKTGYQRQRILAAQYLCLLEPGTPLFNTSAPAWRQQRLLAAM